MCPLVTLRGISKSYAGIPVLRGAQLAVEAGEIHGLVGENGAGKSTLMKILAGETRRDRGEILWEGEPVRLASRADAECLGITMIHQELNLAPHLTVAENLFLGHEPTVRGVIDRARERTEARAYLEELGFDLHPETPVRQLSPARRQLVEIARAAMRTARLVIMDEPTSSLSAKEVAELFRVVRLLQSRGTAVIFVTHRLDELAEVASRVTVLRDGRTVHEGSMPRLDYSHLIRAMVGRELADFYPERAAKIGGVVLRVEKLSHQGNFQEVSFEVRSGEIVGLAGLVGAGRTELLEAIFGIRSPEGVKVYVDGSPARVCTPQDAIRQGLALLTEDRKRTGLAPHLPIAQNITLANLRAVTRKGLLDLRKERQIAESYLELLRIRAQSATQMVGRLSGGNQQKVVLAKWLFTRARVFLVDEPTRGVDVGAKTEVYRHLNKLAESGAAVLMVSSELPEIMGMTDRVLVMRRGRLVANLVTRQASQEEIIRYATLGE